MLEFCALQMQWCVRSFSGRSHCWDHGRHRLEWFLVLSCNAFGGEPNSRLQLNFPSQISMDPLSDIYSSFCRWLAYYLQRLVGTHRNISSPGEQHVIFQDLAHGFVVCTHGLCMHSYLNCLVISECILCVAAEASSMQRFSTQHCF